MDNVKTIADLTNLFDDLLVSGDYPGLKNVSGTRRDRNGDLLVDLVQPGQPEMTTIRISFTADR